MIQLLHGDCLELMKDIPDKSIDMILCDLPYGTTQNQWDSVIPLDALWYQYKRLIKMGGIIALFAQTPFDKVLSMSNIEWLKYEYIWKKKYAPIGDALKKGKEVVDIEVENALYKSATGFVGPDGKYYPPNTTAQIFWLKNRKPAQWRSLDAKEQEARIDKLQAEGKALKAMLEPPENKQDDGFIAALADNSDWEDYEQEAADAEDKSDAADDGSPV